MRQEATVFLVEITMEELAERSFIEDVLGSTDNMIHEFKILKEDTKIIDVEE